MDLLAAINWRYGTKRMTGRKIEKENLSSILEAIRLAPSSRGLQPFKVLVIEDEETKLKIRKIADDQPQVEECSHLLVFAAETGITAQDIEAYIENLARERGISVSKLEGLKQVILRDQLNLDSEAYFSWAARQIYIALAYGQLMANTLKIDAAAMEGFNSIALDSFLALEDQALRSTVLLALGYRDEENDFMLKMKKVRKGCNEMFLFM